MLTTGLGTPLFFICLWRGLSARSVRRTFSLQATTYRLRHSRHCRGLACLQRIASPYQVIRWFCRRIYAFNLLEGRHRRSHLRR